MDEENIESKCLLQVFAKKDLKTGQVFVDGDFPEKSKIFALIGILQTIIIDLVDHNNE